MVVGIRPPPNGGQNHPQPSFWPFLTPGVVLCHLGVVLSPLSGEWVYPLKGVVLSPQRGGFIPPLGHLGGRGGSRLWGGFIPPFR